MNSIVKGVLIFLAGAGAGSGVTYLVLNKKITEREQKRADDKIKSHEEYVHDVESKLKAHEEALRNGYSSDSGSEKPKNSSKFGSVSDDETKNADKKEEKPPLKPVQRDYTQYYIQRRAEEEHPYDSDEDENDIHEALNDPNLRKKEPKLIKYEEFMSPEWEHHDKLTLQYFTEDDILATEEGEILKNVHLHVGDALTKYGFKTNKDESVIFVRNFRLGVDYEIDKIEASYVDSY